MDAASFHIYSQYGSGHEVSISNSSSPKNTQGIIEEFCEEVKASARQRGDLKDDLREDRDQQELVETMDEMKDANRKLTGTVVSKELPKESKAAGEAQNLEGQAADKPTEKNKD